MRCLLKPSGNLRSSSIPRRLKGECGPLLASGGLTGLWGRGFKLDSGALRERQHSRAPLNRLFARDIICSNPLFQPFIPVTQRAEASDLLLTEL
jgi:hypothetical protein